MTQENMPRYPCEKKSDSRNEINRDVHWERSAGERERA